MGYRNIFVSSNAKISVKNEQLIVKTNEITSIPIEDINCLMIDNLYSNLTSYSIVKLIEKRVCIFFCDSKHLPHAIILPINNHCRHLQMINTQLKISKPLQKNLWQKIIRSKIFNQGVCLEIMKKNESDKLKSLSKQVVSGDKKNIEALAARIYFKSLFGKNFSRQQDNIINAMLNYGYSIIRGIIAKNLTVYGFETSLGINHHNELNNFNLADDLIEPFRPIIDLFTAQSTIQNTDLTPKIKYDLFNLVNLNVVLDNANYSLYYALEKTVKNLSYCFKNNSDDIRFPVLRALSYHQYE